MRAGLNATIDRYKADVVGLEKEKRIMEANAERLKAIALAITMKEGEAELEHCCREHSTVWDICEASYLRSLLFTSLFS